tara:strand:+ start:10087 stop:10632 length:546 start_codon:yes stop_codon:yes gene_type:complete
MITDNIILVDIDGTAALGIGKHRKAYDYDKVGYDEPNTTVWEMLEMLTKHDLRVVFLSGRENVTFPGKSERKDKCYRRAYMPNDYKEYYDCYSLTTAWLERWGRNFAIGNDRRDPENSVHIELYMREEGDNRKDSIVKREMYEEYIKPHYNVKLVLDDRNQVVDMWRELGLPCWQVAAGNF